MKVNEALTLSNIFLAYVKLKIKKDRQRIFLVFLIVDWTSLDKESKLDRSISVQSFDVPDSWQNINNGTLDVYIDLEDGSVRQAYLFEKSERKGLYKTRLLSDDALLRFYFKTGVSGFSNSSSVNQNLLL